MGVELVLVRKRGNEGRKGVLICSFWVDGFVFLSRALLGFEIAIFNGLQKSLRRHRAWALFCRFYAF